LRRGLGGLIDLLLPRLCPICRAANLTSASAECCADCSAQVRPLPAGCCSRCALPFVADAGSSHRCAACLREPPPYSHVYAAGLYDGSLKRALQLFKYSGAVDLDRFLAGLLTPLLSCLKGDEILVPVPLHPRRLRRRSYNQSLLLARVLARNLQISLDRALLRRIAATPSQQGLDARQRAVNLQGAFRCQARLAGETLLVIDDVMTTGATLSACSRALLEAGAGRVDVAVVARSPRHGTG